ncbi:MAG TPA: hypothetical protein PLL36_06120 [Candidatus Hydrogenedentes bacterium]|nr:MAG: hypothetical protein BWX80_01811 [Candidatus Hydrogenedentes bacterium ADurb.Bin101]HQN00630.1 hypothetical protein [Candidatus Hydrogenedentota bacterium]
MSAARFSIIPGAWGVLTRGFPLCDDFEGEWGLCLPRGVYGYKQELER